MAFYFELSDKERFTIPEEALASFAKAELMNRGIEEPTPPVLLDVPEIPAPPTITVFTVNIEHRAYVEHGFSTTAHVSFESLQAAQEFMRSNPVVVINRGSKGGPVVVTPIRMWVDMVDVLTIEQYLANGGAIKLAKETQEANANAQEEYNKAQAKATAVYDEIYADWRRVRNLNARYTKVRDTFHEYVRMTQDGNEVTALLFLAKTFSPELIRDTWDWFGISTPTLQLTLPGMTLDENGAPRED